MKKHEILEEGLIKLQSGRGPGKGWWGPPKGSHTGEGGGIPKGWKDVGDDYYYLYGPGDVKAEVGKEGDTWHMKPSQKGFNLRHLKQSDLSQSEAFTAGTEFVEKNKGAGTYKVSYTNKQGRQKTKRVDARDPYDAERKVHDWMKDFWRFSGKRTSAVMR